VSLVTNIDIVDRDKVAAYIKVLQRIGRVKGFSPVKNDWSDDDICFRLEGNSNGMEFSVYDLERLLREQRNVSDSERKKMKELIKKCEGLLRVGVRLTEQKAIRAYTDKSNTSKQLTALLEKREKAYMDVFTRIVPFGDFYKKDKAVEIVNRDVSDGKLRRRMLRLLDLVPEKKSLLLAQNLYYYLPTPDSFLFL